MSVRRFAVGVTAHAFIDAAYNFKENPSADNWMKLDRVMKAHQVAFLTPRDTLEDVLKDAHREQIVPALTTLFDDVREATIRDLINGNVRLIRAEAA